MSRLGLSGARKLSYVECMKCRDRLGSITTNHLKKHGLTTGEYRQRYPTAPMISEGHEEILRKAVLNRQLKRICRKCGKPFTTGCTKAHYCRECQKIRRAISQRRHARRYERKARNSGKDYKTGTFGERYLETENGRVRGAVLLEEHLSINSYHFYRQPLNNGNLFEFEYETVYLRIYLIVWKGKLYCGECGDKVIVARENEQYTIPAEICCTSCGLVYELDQLAELT